MRELLKIENLSKHFGIIQAVNGINLIIHSGETLALVGESGCGKSTFGRALLHLEKPSSGSIVYDGVCLASLNRHEMRKMRRNMQMIFQNPYSSLNPRMTVANIIGEGLDIHRLDRSRIPELLSLVDLERDFMQRYPHQLSGGQKQRVGIARALAVEPRFIVCDEPFSALDVLVKRQIMTLMKRLQKQFNLTYLYITHDLESLESFSDRVAVMHQGKIVELAPTHQLLRNPQHPYTKLLLQN